MNHRSVGGQLVQFLSNLQRVILPTDLLINRLYSQQVYHYHKLKLDKEFVLEEIKWLEQVAGYCDRITSGNVSHNIANIKSGLLWWAELLKKQIEDLSC